MSAPGEEKKTNTEVPAALDAVPSTSQVAAMAMEVDGAAASAPPKPNRRRKQPAYVEVISIDRDPNRTFKIRDVTRIYSNTITASTLEELKQKGIAVFERPADIEVTVHLDYDGTEIDDEEYFQTLDDNTELIFVFPNERWIDPTRNFNLPGPSHPNYDTTDLGAEKARIRQVIGHLQNNLMDVSKVSDVDLDMLSNMDPNSMVDIVGQEFVDQLKEAGRPWCAKRAAEGRVNMLMLIRDSSKICTQKFRDEASNVVSEIKKARMDDSEDTSSETRDTNMELESEDNTTESDRTGTATGLSSEETSTPQDFPRIITTAQMHPQELTSDLSDSNSTSDTKSMSSGKSSSM